MANDKNQKKPTTVEIIRNIITAIKQNISNKIMPNPGDISKIRDLAAKYPNDGNLQDLLAKAEELFIKAQEIADQELQNSQNTSIKAYSPEEYQELLRKENEYFNDSKTQARHNLIDKTIAGSRINDADQTGNSITSQEFTNFINDISTQETRDTRQQACELLSYDAVRLKEKRESGIELNELDKARETQVHQRVEKVVQEELYDARFQQHKIDYARENGKEIDKISIEEVVKAKGNQIIDEVVEIVPKIKQAFHGVEEKLAALVFHNPSAIGEHHNDIERLRAEADIAHQQQKIYEEAKKQERKDKIIEKTETKQVENLDGKSDFVAKKKKNKTKTIDIENRIKIDTATEAAERIFPTTNRSNPSIAAKHVETQDQNPSR